MQDLVIKQTGNSRTLKSSLDAGTTWEQARAMLRSGTFPIDILGLVSTGVQTTGTPLNKATLLSADTTALLGLTDSSATVDDALKSLIGVSNFIADYFATNLVTTQQFNDFCRVRGVSTGATWAATCRSATAKAQIMQDGTLMSIIMKQPTLQADFGAIVFNLANIKNSIKGGWYTSWDIGSTVDISLSAFTMQASFAAATATFELVGIDHDVDPNGNTLPLTLFMKNLHTATNFKMYDSNVNTFTNCYPYTQRANMKAALPSAWQAAMAPLVRKQIMSSGNGGILTNYDLPCFLYREGEIFATRTYSAEAEFNACKRYAIYTKGLGTLPKKQTNGAGSAYGFWECSPYSGASNYFCIVNSNGNAYYTNASYSYGLCFGFCLARDQS